MNSIFPYYGGKSKVSDLIWSRLGDVTCYSEPFFGSGAVFLGRPTSHARIYERVNDLSGDLVNLWRAVKYDPRNLCALARWPRSEIDIVARNNWLRGNPISAKLKGDPKAYDTERAAWYWFGMSSMLRPIFLLEKMSATMPKSCNAWLYRNVLDDSALDAISDRFRKTEIYCGDWKRLLATRKHMTQKGGIGGVFLDPPYSPATRHKNLYPHDGNFRESIADWCRAYGAYKDVRICLAGYAGEYDCEYDLPDWEAIHWQTGNEKEGNVETLWFSPYCLHEQLELDLSV